MGNAEEVGVFLGLGVGKSAHHEHVRTPARGEGSRQADAQQ